MNNPPVVYPLFRESVDKRQITLSSLFEKETNIILFHRDTKKCEYEENVNNNSIASCIQMGPLPYTQHNNQNKTIKETPLPYTQHNNQNKTI